MLFSLNFNYCPFKVVAIKTKFAPKIVRFHCETLLFYSIKFNQHAKNKGEKRKENNNNKKGNYRGPHECVSMSISLLKHII